MVSYLVIQASIRLSVLACESLSPPGPDAAAALETAAPHCPRQLSLAYLVT